jgi:baseplate J-like protein
VGKRATDRHGCKAIEKRNVCGNGTRQLMAFNLPNLDDRRWSDFVDEARSLIPYYAPQWTNENPSDPGITLIELLAWVAEMDLYQINRVPQSHLRRFLELIGLRPKCPRAARTVLALEVEPKTPPVRVPAGLEFEATDASGNLVPVRVLDELTIVDAAIRTVMVQETADTVPSERTSRFQRGQTFEAFGPDPCPGAALYLGLNNPPPVEVPLRFYFQITGEGTGDRERQRIVEQNERRLDVTRSAWSLSSCCDRSAEAAVRTPAIAQKTAPVLTHHSARTVWEYASANGWTPLQGAEQVVDQTRQFSLRGPVTLILPESIEPTAIGTGGTPFCFIRCRFVSGMFDTAPLIAGITMNAAEVEQAVPAGTTFQIAKTTVPSGTLPAPIGGTSRVSFTVNAQSQINKIQFSPADAPQTGNPQAPILRVLAYSSPTDATLGALTLEIICAGTGNGRPLQRFTLPSATLIGSHCPRVFTMEAERWFQWELRENLDASKAADRHVVVDARIGAIRFGDGQRGRVPPTGSLVFLDGLLTLGSRGNLAAETRFEIRDSPNNVWQLGPPVPPPSNPPLSILWSALLSATNPFAASSGCDGQAIAEAAAAAPKEREAVHRAVTLADYETLACETPGVRLARAAAVEDVHPAFPCSRAVGFVTVVVLPYVPLAQPVPSDGLLRSVATWLTTRRVVGTNVVVVGPAYTTVAVQASITAGRGAVSAIVQQQIIDAINTFLNAITGGETGKGWPIGRPVYRAEVLDVIARVNGVDHVTSLALVADDGPPTCSNVCIGSLGLVAPGTHQITVTTAAGGVTSNCPQPVGAGIGGQVT